VGHDTRPVTIHTTVAWFWRTEQRSFHPEALMMSNTRRRFVQFLVTVAAVHVIAIALYYALGVARMPTRDQRAFAWGWMGVTIAVVLLGLQRIKRARKLDRGGRRQ
jgi:hypothetical protein